MLKIQEIIDDRAQVRIPVGTGWITAHFRPSALTWSWVVERGQGRPLDQVLAAVLLDWDLTEEDETPVPTTAESLSRLPEWLKADALRRIDAHTAPEEEETVQLKVWLASEGARGRCPEWYRVILVSRYLNCAPWELIKQPDFWNLFAAVGGDAEAYGRREIRKREEFRARNRR